MRMKVILRFFLDDHVLGFLMSLLSTEHYLPRKDFLFISVYKTEGKMEMLEKIVVEASKKPNSLFTLGLENVTYRISVENRLLKQ